jgi:transglutaminase-like putative cysteine protease
MMARWSALFSRLGRTAPLIRPSLTLFFWLVGAFLLTLAPHIEQFPIWLSVVIILAMVVRSILEIYRLPLPSTTFCAIVALCLLIGILLQFSTIFGRDAGTAFMAGLLTIKFFELRGPRDIALITFSSFFVVMSALLYSQAVELFIYCLIMMWLLTGILLRVHMGDEPDNLLLRLLGKSGIIFCQALPLTIFLFFFFPRFSGKLQIGLDATSIGITDRVEPGSISRLADDDSTAFYAHLTGDNIPGADAMYWRAMVLWHYQNGTWTQEAPNPRTGEVYPVPDDLPQPAPRSSQISQTIVIFPHFQKWLFALDYPTKPATNTLGTPHWSTPISGGVLQLSDQTGKLDHKEQYTVISSSELAERDLIDRDKALQLPDYEVSPRVRALADQLYRANPNPREYILSVLHYFRSEHFLYSDSPGKSGENINPLDDFLFVKKRGFCEHFASAFAILMRLKNCPARMVVGYHGGQYNPYKDFYTVKQSNAHAWDEVWIDDDRRWERVDPTAALSSSEGIPLASDSSAQSEGDESLTIQVAHHRFTFLSSANTPGWLRRTLLEMQLRRQQIEADWDDWVFSYDPEAQDRLAQAMGFGQDNRFPLILICLVAAGACVGVFRYFMKQKRAVAPVENFYAQFCRTMTQRGMPRAIWEGPLDYTHRVAEAFPEKKEAIHNVGWIVACSRYGRSAAESSDPKKLKSLLLLIAASGAASSSRACG